VNLDELEKLVIHEKIDANTEECSLSDRACLAMSVPNQNL
jgi:hypothetical protein